MMRFLLRHGAVRLIGGRAVPALMLIDLAMLANRARKVPVVDRNLRRGCRRRPAEGELGHHRPPRASDDEDPPHEHWSPPPR